VKDTNRKTRDQTTEDEQHGPIKNWGRRFQLIRKGTTSILRKWGKHIASHQRDGHCIPMKQFMMVAVRRPM